MTQYERCIYERDRALKEWLETNDPGPLLGYADWSMELDFLQEDTN